MNEIRSVVKHVRMTEDESGQLEELARQNGMSVSAYIRTAVFGLTLEKVPYEMMEQIKELNFQCRKIGTNINQIVHICNAKQDVTIFDYQNLTTLQNRLLKRTDEVYQILREAYS